MKALGKLFVLGAVAFLSACSSTYHAGSQPDDVYSTGEPSAAAPPPAVSHSTPSHNDGNYYNGGSQSNSNNNDPSGYSNSRNGNYSSEQYKDSGNNYITNNYYGDDYYDYSYSSRLRRYYSPMPGYGFYDPYYTNSYWYDYNPASWGVSIYLGYHWWAPSFYYYDPFFCGPSFGFGFGFGYPYYSAFYNPYYPFGGYGLGYYHGYWDGYYSALYGGYNNPYYYNSFEGTSYHYGPRGSLSGNGTTVLPAPRSMAQRGTIGDKYQQAVVENRVPDLSAGSLRTFNTGVNPVSRTTSPTLNNGTQSEKSSGGTVVRNNGAPAVNSVPVKNAGTSGGETTVSQPGRGIISQKNERGGSVAPSSVSGNNVRGSEVSPVIAPNEHVGTSNNTNAVRSMGGTSRPNISGQSLSKPSNSRPQTLTPQRNIQGSSGNSGGTLQPQFNQPSRGQSNQGYSQPGNQRNYNRSGEGRTNRGFDRPRQYQQSQPQRIQPRSEPRQFSAPSQRSVSPPHNSGGGGGLNIGGGGKSSSGGGGRRK